MINTNKVNIFKENANIPIVIFLLYLFNHLYTKFNTLTLV